MNSTTPKSIVLYIQIIALCLYLASCSNEDIVERQPNILFCLADDVSYPHMGAYGCNWVQTPNFDKVAEQGLLFTNAYTPNAKCGPSRSIILTGRHSWQLKEAANHFSFFPNEFKTYAEALNDHGYFVGSTGKKWAPGDPGRINGKKRQLCGPGWDQHKKSPPTPQMSDNNYAENFKQFINDKPADKPFCFWFGSLEPHRAYEFNSSVRVGGLDPSSIGMVPHFWPDSDSVRIDMMDYAFELNHFDQHLGQMLQFLEEIGELENTIVVVTSDNGMPFPRAKGQAYAYSNHLPMAIMWTNGIHEPGREIDDYVSFIDLAPTFLDIAGLSEEKSGMQKMTGHSLTNIFLSPNLMNPESYRDHVLIGKERHDIGRPHDQGYPIRGIFCGDHLYVRNFKPERWPTGNPEMGYPNVDASPTKTEVLKTLHSNDHLLWELSFGKRAEEELYNVKTDPFCMNNLINKSELFELKTRLKRMLKTELIEQKDPRFISSGDVFDQYHYSGKDSNYYERQVNGEVLNASWIDIDDKNYIPKDIE